MSYLSEENTYAFSVTGTNGLSGLVLARFIARALFDHEAFLLAHGNALRRHLSLFTVVG